MTTNNKHTGGIGRSYPTMSESDLVWAEMLRRDIERRKREIADAEIDTARDKPVLAGGLFLSAFFLFVFLAFLGYTITHVWGWIAEVAQ
jgi:hypothetical protein